MRVLLAANSYLPAIGGVERYLSELAKILLILGHEVTVLCRRPDPSLPSVDTIGGVRVIRHPGPALPGFFFPARPMAGRNIIARAAKRLLVSPPNLIVSRFPSYTLALKRVFPGVPLIHVVPTVTAVELATDLDGPSISMKENFISRFMAPFGAREERLALATADRVVTFSRNVRSLLLEEHGRCGAAPLPEERGKSMPIPRMEPAGLDGKIEIIPPGVDTGKFRPAMPGEEMPEPVLSLNIPAGARKVLFAGRLKHMKGADIALRAFASASKILGARQIPSILVILGSGPEKEVLENLAMSLGISKSVIFLPATGTIERWYQHFDLLLHTSRLEPFGHVILEAMASGLPVFSFRSAPPDFRLASEEIIVDGVSGCLAEPGREWETGPRLALALSDPVVLASMGKAARSAMEDFFSWKLHAERLLGNLDG